MRPVHGDDVTAYDRELVSRLEALLGPSLVGVYAAGSWALGDYVPGRSDLDRFVVCGEPLRIEAKQEAVERLRHESLPCPARGLELVVYTRAQAGSPDSDAGFELNLNSGCSVPLHVSFDAADEPRHWFVVDRAIVREQGLALAGPPPAEVFGEIPRATVLAALSESLAWHRANAEEAGENLVLSAVRAWHYAVEGTWTSKLEAAEWARGRLADTAVLDAALEERYGATRPAESPRAPSPGRGR
jgi:aminoglycoside adenylyltransferase-like protein